MGFRRRLDGKRRHDNSPVRGGRYLHGCVDGPRRGGPVLHQVASGDDQLRSPDGIVYLRRDQRSGSADGVRWQRLDGSRQRDHHQLPVDVRRHHVRFWADDNSRLSGHRDIHGEVDGDRQSRTRRLDLAERQRPLAFVAMADNARIDDLRRRIQKDPASIAFAQLAEELRRAGQFEESVETCRAGLAPHPGYLSARVTLGRALIELNQLEEAQGELEHVLKNASENLAAIRGLGEIHHRRGELKKALRKYRAALALGANDPDLEETVAQPARQVEPQKPAVPTDGLSSDQMQGELLKLAPPPPAPAPAASAAQVAPPPPSPVPAASAAQVAPPPPAPVPAASAAQVAPSPPPVASAAQAAPPPPPPIAAASAAQGAPPPPPPSLIPIAEPAAVAEIEVAPPIEEPVPSEAELEHAARSVAALEDWLDAIPFAPP